MPDLWIWLGFFGGAFQAFRIAGQRLVSSAVVGQARTPSIWASPLSRVFIGVPISALVVATTLHRSDTSPHTALAALNASFLLWISAAAALQLVATIVQTSLVKRRNFAIGIVYLKIMVPAQAVFGMLLFAEQFTPLQWSALAVVTVGVFLLGRARLDTAAQSSERQPWDWISLWMGLGAGIVLAFTGLFIREANLALPSDTLGPVAQGMISLFVLASMQLTTCIVAIAIRDPSEFLDLARRCRLIAFTGLMSVSGSACWFIGFALASPALVNAVGQSEFLFAMLLSMFFFRERPTASEWMGTAVVFIGIVLLLLA